jgi:tetratricopeptide (TPR) repeat protein
MLLNNEGSIERRLGQQTEAESSFRQARALLEAAARPDLSLEVYVLANLSQVRSERKDYREAAALCSSALDLAAPAVLPAAPLASITEHCAVAMRRIGEKAEADRLRARAKELAADVPRQPSDGLLVDARSLGPRN